MKTLYLIKSLLPLILLPIAPGILQIELTRQGFLTGTWAVYLIATQGVFTLGTIFWIAFSVWRRNAKAFLRMSCVSKKVCFQGKWMSVETYLAEHHNVVVSHGFTPEESQAWLAEAEEYLREQFVTDVKDTAPLSHLEDARGARQLEESAV